MSCTVVATLRPTVVLATVCVLTSHSRQAQNLGGTKSDSGAMLRAAPAGPPANKAGSWVNLGDRPGGLGHDTRMQPHSPGIMRVTSASGGKWRSAMQTLARIGWQS